MDISSRTTFRSGVAALFLAVASVAAAQNLIPDPTFSSGISGWEVRNDPGTSNEILWSQEAGADGVPGFATLRAPFGLGAAFARICLPVQPGATYSWGGFLRPYPEVFSSAFLIVYFYQDSACAGPNVLSSAQSAVIGSPDPFGWHLVRGPDITAPAQAVSVAFEVTLLSPGLSGGRVDFDNVFFGPQGIGPPSAMIPVPTISTFAFVVLAVSLALVGIISVLRR